MIFFFHALISSLPQPSAKQITALLPLGKSKQYKRPTCYVNRSNTLTLSPCTRLAVVPLICEAFVETLNATVRAVIILVREAISSRVLICYPQSNSPVFPSIRLQVVAVTVG